MKKIIISLIALLFISNCVLLDSLGLNIATGTVKGSEAKKQILTGALLGAAATGSSTTMISAIVVSNTQGIKDNKFYDKSDVDQCAEDVILYNALLSSRARGIAIGALLCDSLREHKTLIDWPIPLF